jgi:hypothetical protein
MKKHHIYQVVVWAALLISMPFIFARESLVYLEAAQTLGNHGIITRRVDISDYRFESFASLQEIATIALNLRELQGEYVQYFNSADDVAFDVPKSIVEKARESGLIPDIFAGRPENAISRVVAYSVLMNSVCMTVPRQDQPVYSSWEAAVYDNAYQHGLTDLSFADFHPDESILREEAFLIAMDAFEWVDSTGGCQEHHLNDIPFGQEPGTFVKRFITVTEDIYSYIVTSDTPTSVKTRALAALGLTAGDLSSLTLRDENGVALPAGAQLSQNELVYIYFTRPLQADVSEQEFSSLRETAFGQEPGSFIKRFITTTEDIHSYITQGADTVSFVKNFYINTFGLPSTAFQALEIRDEAWVLLDAGSLFGEHELIYVYYTRPLAKTVSQDEYSYLRETAFGQEPGTFVKRFETIDEYIYSYIVQKAASQTVYDFDMLSFSMHHFHLYPTSLSVMLRGLSSLKALDFCLVN